MRSTMQDVPLTVATIMRYAADVNGDRTVTTAMGRGCYRTTTLPRARRAGRAAGQCAARASAIAGDERVGTFMWNNAEHLTAYVAVPSMGAVLHTLNIRLSPEQIAYIANEAEDQVIVADVSLTAQLAPVLPLLDTVHTVIAVGDGDLAPLTRVRQDGGALRGRARRGVADVRLARGRREVRRRDVLHQRHHGKPERRCLQPPFDVPSHDGGVRGQWVRVLPQ